jgi:RHS repeat-associated protein
MTIFKMLLEYQPVIVKYYYYASDQINSTRIITNSSGTVVYSALFDPYGGMQKQWVNTYSPSLKFSGKERESKSEMDYFGAKYYDHKRYRFISVDPVINKDEALVNPQLWNLYSYCRNNPITFFDPDGCADLNLANIAWKVGNNDYSVTVTFKEGGNNPVKETLKTAFEASIKAAVEGGADITSINITCTTNGTHSGTEHGEGRAIDIGLVNGKNPKKGTGVDTQVSAIQEALQLQSKTYQNFGPALNKIDGVNVTGTDTINKHKSHIHFSVNKEEGK